MTGIEPASSVWKTEALPLSYIRARPRTFSCARAGTIVPQRHPWSRTGAVCSRAPVHHHEGAVVVGLLHRVDQQLRAPVEAAAGRGAPRARPACPCPARCRAAAVSTSPSVNSSSPSPGRQLAPDAVELGVLDQPEHRTVGVQHLPAARCRRAATRPAGGRPCAARSPRWAGRGAGGSRWRTPLPSPARGGSRWPQGRNWSPGSAETMPLNAPERNSDRGPGLHALAGHVDHHQVELVVGGAPRHDEVAGERGATGRLRHRLHQPLAAAGPGGCPAWRSGRAGRRTSTRRAGRRRPGDCAGTR